VIKSAGRPRDTTLMPARYSEIAAEIAERIRSGVLSPGDKLPSTRELCEQYRVSETVIRFVMIQLKAEKLVEGQPGRGVFVTERPRT
jgi:DNA-binding FadR family transcriptional regulator